MSKRSHSGDVKRAKKQKTQPEPEEPQSDDDITKQEKPKEAETIPWPDSDVLELINRIEKHIPHNDSLSFGCRVDRIDWTNITFKNHSVKECKHVWSILLKQIRKFRLLKEITNDMRAWIESPKPSAQKTNIFKHPEKPKQPPNSYMLFIEEKRYEVMSEYPDLSPNDLARKMGELFRNLPSKEKERYIRKAKAAREKYAEELEHFYSEHPEHIPKRKSRRSKRLVEFQKRQGPPEKPKTPFQLFLQVESEKADTDDRFYIHHKYKDKWNDMTNKDKLFWIKWAEEQYNKYLEDLKEYLKIHPDYEPEKFKSILSKKEKKIRDKYAGKPEKPPHSAYHLFTKMIMENEEVRKINHKEAVNYISEKWRGCSEEERNEYRTRVDQMWEEYDRKMEAYIESLPPEERDKAEEEFAKRKRPESKEKKKVKEVERVKVDKPKLPPLTEYKYFLSLYQGKENPATVWKNMTEDEKQMYEEELADLKKKYISEYEEYLKSLTKEELQKLGDSQTDQYDTSSESSESDDSANED